MSNTLEPVTKEHAEELILSAKHHFKKARKDGDLECVNKSIVALLGEFLKDAIKDFRDGYYLEAVKRLDDVRFHLGMAYIHNDKCKTEAVAKIIEDASMASAVIIMIPWKNGDI